MKKSGARGRHKWKWHKKTERAVFSLVAIANTKASGETLIEATEWHEQSNWISSAVSSNLIWPALWRMTGERNALPCPPLPLGVPHTLSDPQTCRFLITTGRHLLPGPLLHTTPPGRRGSRVTLSPHPHPSHPGFLCLSHTSAASDRDLQTVQGQGRAGEELQCSVSPISDNILVIMNHRWDVSERYAWQINKSVEIFFWKLINTHWVTRFLNVIRTSSSFYTCEGKEPWKIWEVSMVFKYCYIAWIALNYKLNKYIKRYLVTFWICSILFNCLKDDSQNKPWNT